MIPRIDIKATGENIKRLMDETGTTKEDIVTCCGVTIQTVYSWLSGRRFPSADNLVVLSWIFGCKVDDIIAVAYG
jgi:transcriptional regulator with XRE-family HTH domain